MNDRYFADKIIELSNKELEINEYRDRIIAILAEVRAEERTKHLAKGTDTYKRIDEQNTIREMPSRDVEVVREVPTINSLTNEGRFIQDDKIEEL